jgi:hypothetical protein
MEPGDKNALLTLTHKQKYTEATTFVARLPDVERLTGATTFCCGL